MTITKDQVKALLAAEGKATPKPWTRGNAGCVWNANYTSGIAVVLTGPNIDEPGDARDADLIPIMRNNIRALCESWIEQQEKLALSEVKKFEHRDALINRAEAAEFKLTQTQDALEIVCEALESARHHMTDCCDPFFTARNSVDAALKSDVIQAARKKK